MNVNHWRPRRQSLVHKKVRETISAQSSDFDCINRTLDALHLQGWHEGTGERVVLSTAVQSAQTSALNLDDFEIVGRAGKGQYGVVDAAKCKIDGRVYAIKTVPKQVARRAGQQLSLANERAVHLAARISDTSLVPRLMAAFQSELNVYLVTDFAPCGTLWDHMNRYTNMDEAHSSMALPEIQWWAGQMVASIEWLHCLGYAHRDIKPHNFLLLPTSRLLLTDFGSSAPLIRSEPSGKLQVPLALCAVAVGTPDYVAPEVLQLAEEAILEAADSVDVTSLSNTALGYDASVDWWSFGATLFEMAMGRPPFYMPTVAQTYEKISRCGGESSIDIPLELEPLRSLLQSLLVTSDSRLGGKDPEQVRSHAFFNAIEQSLPPTSVRTLPLKALDTLDLTFAESIDYQDITFDHFFRSSPGLSNPSSSQTRPTDPQDASWHLWLGWSWQPSEGFFDPKPAVTDTARASSAYPRTPRTTSSQHASPGQVPSSHRGVYDMNQCVLRSARKKSQNPPLFLQPADTQGSPALSPAYSLPVILTPTGFARLEHRYQRLLENFDQLEQRARRIQDTIESA